MGSEENRREQSTGGSGSHGGGKVCHRCGWVYPKAQPSKKHRAAHRKHCGAAASKPADDVVDVAGAVDEEASDRPGDTVVEEESKSEGGAGKAADQTGGDSAERSKVVILDSNIAAADNSPESHALHHNNKVQSSDEEPTARQLVNSASPDNHSVTHKDMKSSSLLPAIKESLINASEKTSCAMPQNAVDSATIENDNSTESYVEVKSDLCISELLILPHSSSGSSSATDTGLQKIDKYMESTAMSDLANATTLMSGPHEVSANTRKPESFICYEVEEKINPVGQSFYREKCTSGIYVLPVDDSAHSSRFEFQIGKDACSYVNQSEPEDQQTLPVGSGAILAAATKMKSESLENSRFDRTVPSTCASSKSGSDLGRDIVEIPNVVLSELLVVKSDQNTSIVFSNMVVNEGHSLHSNDDQYRRDENSGSSQLANELKLVESMTKFGSPNGELDSCETEKQIGSLVLSAEQAVGLGGEVTKSCETCYSPTEFQGHNSRLFCEGTLADNLLRNEDSAVTLPDVIQFNASPEISTKCEIISQEATRADSEVAVDEEKEELIKEQSSYGDSKADSQPEDSVTELLSPFRCSSGGISNSNIDQPHFQGTHQKICNASVDEIIEQPNREVGPLVNEAITENGLPDDNCNRLNIHEGETSDVESICGSQQDAQNIFKARNDDSVSSIKNDLNPFTSEIDHFLNIEERNSILDIFNKESNSELDEINLCQDGEGIPKTAKYPTAEIVQYSNEKMDGACDSKTDDTQEDSSSIFYQSSKEKDVNEQMMPQVDSYTAKIDESIDFNHQREQQDNPCTGKIDDSFDSNRQDGSIEAILSSVPAIASPRYAAIEVPNSDAKASPSAESQATKDLCVSEDLTAGALQKINDKNNGGVEGSSSIAPVKPGQVSISNETESVLTSKHEAPKGRNISCDVKASLPTDSRATRDLCISAGPTTGGALHKSDDRNNSEVEGCSSVPLVEPGRISISADTESILNSKHEEPEGRNISCDGKASSSTDTLATKDLCFSDDPTAGGAKGCIRENGEVEGSSVPLVEPGRMPISIKTELILSSKDEPGGRNISCDAKASEPSDSQAAQNLHTSDDPTASATLPQGNVENNGKVEGSSSAAPVEPGRKSISVETESILNSKHEEPEGRNISEEPTAMMISCNSGKPHVMLKNLLAEANAEGKQMDTRGQGNNASLTSKKTWDLQDGHSDKPKKHSMNQTDHRDWNSPARLPVPPTKHEKKKSKGKQSWVPFICCPFMR